MSGAEATTALRLPPPQEPPPPLRWGPWIAVLAGGILVAAGLLHLTGFSAATLAAVVAGGVMVMVIVGLYGRRANQRRAEAASMASVVGQLLRSPVVLLRVRWRGIGVGRIVRLRVQYTDLAAAVYGPQLGWRVAQAVEQVTGRAFVVRRQRERLRQLLLAEKSAQSEETLTDLDRQRLRVGEVAHESFGVDATVTKIKTTDTLVSEFTVNYRSAAKAMTVPAVRRRTTIAVGERLTGMWKAQFALEDDSVTFKRRPPLPTYVPRPTTPAPTRQDDAYSLIPQGVDEDGQVICWDISGSMAHMLRAGRTRSGKTVLVIGDALECARRGMPVYVVDPKRVEFMGLRSWPNVQYVATTVTQQIALIYKLKLEMDERYRQVEEEGFSDAEFQPILLIIDEYRQLYSNVQAWWKSIKVAGMPAECPIFEWIASLLRMAAYCRIHVDLATQRPDAAFLGGEALATDTPIPTPTGWSTMGDLQVGQEVFDEQGSPTRVVNATNVLNDRPCFKVIFSDHSTLIADCDHLWAVKDTRQRASDTVAGRSLSRHDLYPRHSELAGRLAALPRVGADVTVSEIEHELGGGRIGLLRRGLNDGRWGLTATGTRPGVDGRYSARTFNRAALLTALSNECVAPAPSWRRTGTRIVTTSELRQELYTPQGHHNLTIATTGPLVLPDADLPIDPWLLGYWLGDGHKATATIATADGEVLDRIRALGYRVSHYARYNYGISTGPRGGWNRPSLKRSLRELGLLHNKHVPQVYLRASERQRRELLAGLLDSDGCCSVRSRGTPSGQVIFANTDRRLIDAVLDLTASLGMVATSRCVREAGVETCPTSVAYGRRTRAAWVVTFTPKEQVFGIGRKRAKLAPAIQPVPDRRWRHVVAVEPVPSVPVRCITVAADSHLYLAGTSYIPTHNCRDNFSARAATGRLSPDGAEMMFDSAHVGVNIPLNVRGRGTIVGVDDQPKEVQFFYTPDPRRPRNDDDRALLASLRPAATQWPALTMSLPDPESFADEIPEGKKTNLEWEQLLRARFDPTAPAEARPDQELIDTPANEDPTEHADDLDALVDDLDDTYRGPSMVPAGMVSIGDLLNLDDVHGWVTVSDLARDDGAAGHGEVQLEWRDDNGTVGDLILGRGELLEIRRPKS